MRQIKLLTIVIIASLVLSTGIAFGETEISRGTGTSYTHNEKFDECVVIHGVDVSQFQGKINWDLMKAAGVDFAIIRIGGRSYSTGAIYNDDYFEDYYEGASKAGILLGAYFFSQATTKGEAIEEVEYCVRKLAGRKLDLPLFMDYEGGGGNSAWLNAAHLSIEDQTDIAIAFCEAVRSYGYEPGFYSYLSYMRGSNAHVYGAILSEKYPVWIAQYAEECNYKNDYFIWQYSSSGKLRGTQGSSCDLDYWYLEKDTKLDITKLPMLKKQMMFADVKIDDKVLSYVYGDCVGYEPHIKVRFGDKELIEGLDYTVEYYSNYNVGTAFAKVVGKGNYDGYKFVSYEISPSHDISDLNIEKTYTVKYTGKVIKPTAINILEPSGNRITGNLDYAFDNFKAKNVGTYSVKIALFGNYIGSAYTKIKIVKGTQTITIGNQPSKVYDDHKPIDLKVSKKFSDGSISFKSSNTKVATVSSKGIVTIKGTGKAKITITAPGTSNYEGAKKEFTIEVVKKPKEPKPVKKDLSKLRAFDRLHRTERSIFTWKKVTL